METLLKELREKYPHMSIEVEQIEGTDKYRLEMKGGVLMETEDIREVLRDYVAVWGY